jgi:hypothetical protein
MIGPMPETPSRMPGAPTRRSVLAALGLTAAALPLAACGIRLEDDAPRVPLVPTREPIPGEAFLLGLWLGSQDLAEEAAALGGASTALPARLAVLHRTQSEVLRTLLRSEGVPDGAVRDARSRHTSGSGAPTTPATTSATAAPARSASPTPAPPGTQATSSAPRRSGLAAAESAALSAEAFAALGVLDARAVATAAAALAQRAVAATLLARAPSWPVPEPVTPSLAARALETARSATYGIEVVAAQSSGSQRRLATTTLAALRSRVTALEELAGSSATPPDLGYPLPFAVTSASAARRLALHVLDGLRAGHAAAATSAARDPSGLAAVVQWLAEAEMLCHRWGMPLQPFPGLE